MKKNSKFSLCIISILLLLTLVFSSVAAAENVFTVKVPVKYGQTEARSMLKMVNDFRTGSDSWYWNSDNKTKTQLNSLKSLVYDYELEKIAMQRAAEIAVCYAHERPNGSSCFTAYTGTMYSCGENIAAGYLTAESVFTAWQESNYMYEGQGHRRNMLNQNFTAIGIGHVYYNGYHYWVQEFRNPASNTAVTEANDSLTDVSVDILSSKIKTMNVSSDIKNITLEPGMETAMPKINISLTLTQSWPGYSPCVVKADNTWTVSDTSVAEISSDKLTAVKKGSTTLTASALGEIIKLPVTVSDHIAVIDKAVEPTCTKSGKTEGSHCSLCEKILVSQETIAPTGHTTDKGTVTKAVTCTADGTKTYKCTVCKAVIRTETLNATGHKIVTLPAVAATCEKSGKTAGSKCSVCGAVTKAQSTVKANGHTEVKLAAVKATASKSGLTEGKKCSVCGKILVAQKMTLAQVTGVKSENEKTTSLKLSWSKVNGAKYYKVEQSTDGKTWKTVTTTDKTSYTVKSLKVGTKYQFRVTALDSSKKISAKASKVLKTGTLTSDPTVTLKSSKSKTVAASWKKVTGASKYVLYKSIDGKKWNKVATTTKLTYTFTKLTANKKIYVKVTAVNAYGKESAGAVKNVTVKK